MEGILHERNKVLQILWFHYRHGLYICPKCGKQVEALKGTDIPTPVVINNSASSSTSAAVSAVIATPVTRELPWDLRTSWILILGFLTGGIYWIIGFILRVTWK